MNMIDYLDYTVSQPVITQEPSLSREALRVYYAVMLAYLSDDFQYNRVKSLSIQELYPNLWQDPAILTQIILELSSAYQMPTFLLQAGLGKVTPLAYQRVLSAAEKEDPQAFLQNQLPFCVPYLPAWALAFLPSMPVPSSINQVNPPQGDSIFDDPAFDQVGDQASNQANQASIFDDINLSHPAYDSAKVGASTVDRQNRASASIADRAPLESSKIAQTGSVASRVAPPSYRQTQKRSSVNLGLVFLGAGTLVLVGSVWLAWQKFNQTTDNLAQNAQNIQMALPTPTELEAQKQPQSAQQPASFYLGLDDAGLITACQAKVGSPKLEQQIKKALNQVFSGQLGRCDFITQESFATTLPLVKDLTSVFAFLQSVEFATFKINNNQITLSAPNATDLANLKQSIQNLSPNTPINTIEPPPASQPVPSADPQLATNSTQENAPQNYIQYGSQPNEMGQRPLETMPYPPSASMYRQPSEIPSERIIISEDIPNGSTGTSISTKVETPNAPPKDEISNIDYDGGLMLENVE